MDLHQHLGKVILAGAGPGDPELITVRAARYLMEADVILIDRLVSKEILDHYANPNAEVVYVGKQHRNESSTPQPVINELLLTFARKGKLVVRLKGGDVSVFSNIMDELETLVNANIPYEIIPGITAALGAAAYTGIPLTAREHSTAVRLLTCYKPETIAESYWQQLAETDDTLVFYMSGQALEIVASKLVSHKIHDSKLLAIVEQATTPQQQVRTMSVYEYDKLQLKPKLSSPSLVIIGKVVGLHESFKWLETGSTYPARFNDISQESIAEKFNEAIA